MPGFDGTGPLGLGPMTGRGMGYCAIPLSSPGRVAYGYAGLAGMPLLVTHLLNNPYSSRIAPNVPFRRPWFGFRFGRGWRRGWFGRGSGRGWFGFGRGRRRWLYGW
ncbi:MAG: DUF5320 domain-containing protein [candidate division WOR-3 bacterium]|nr:DUF5320 domain-containing protein [candidate division WOR-3 bacterium]MDH5683794.1 DUF5320 domain-containing protein [candidate division WOR-3 bacterium]